MLAAPPLSALTGAEVFVKYENLQVTNSFKERGACVKLAALSADERRRGVIAMSAGNHAQAVAYHARRLAIAATIVMPVTTPFVKVKATEALGAEVVLDGETVTEAQARAEAIAAERDLVWVHPYDDPQIIAGQGTVALEMLEEEPPGLDVLVVPIGGGGLIAGCAIAARAKNPSIEIVGVECALYPSTWNAIHKENRPCGGATLAEGIAVKNAGKLTLPVVRDYVSDIILVDEPAIERAVNAFLTLQKAMAEGAGAAGLAAVLAEPERFPGRKVGLILSGGNIDPRILASIMVRELERARPHRLVPPHHPRPPWNFGPDRDAARWIGRQHPQRRSSSVVPRRSRQGRQARCDHGNPRRRPRRRNLSRVRRRRLSAGAHAERHGAGVRRRSVAGHPRACGSELVAFRPQSAGIAGVFRHSRRLQLRVVAHRP